MNENDLDNKPVTDEEFEDFIADSSFVKNEIDISTVNWKLVQFSDEDLGSATTQEKPEHIFSKTPIRETIDQMEFKMNDPLKEAIITPYKQYALSEFKLAGWLNEDGTFKDPMQEAVCNNVLQLLDVFGDEGHSGTSAPYTINLFRKLASFNIISPLTGEDSEWNDVSEYGGTPKYQNKRLSSVFKDATGRAYNIEGRVFWEWAVYDGEVYKSYFTGTGSAVDITFPYSPPEKPEYVFVPTEQFPNESLN